MTIQMRDTLLIENWDRSTANIDDEANEALMDLLIAADRFGVMRLKRTKNDTNDMLNSSITRDDEIENQLSIWKVLLGLLLLQFVSVSWRKSTEFKKDISIFLHVCASRLAHHN